LGKGRNMDAKMVSAILSKLKKIPRKDRGERAFDAAFLCGRGPVGYNRRQLRSSSGRLLFASRNMTPLVF